MSELLEKVPRHLRHPRLPGGMSTTKGDYFYRIPFITALIIMDFILTAGGGYGCRIIASVILCMPDRTIFSTPRRESGDFGVGGTRGNGDPVFAEWKSSRASNRKGADAGTNSAG